MEKYMIVEFEDGSVGTVLEEWLTPDKNEVYWPPYEEKFSFHRALSRKEAVNLSTWSLFPVKRCLYKTDNLQKALQKESLAEEYSNLESAAEEEIKRSRKRFRPVRFCDTDEDEEELARPLKRSVEKDIRPRKRLLTPARLYDSEDELDVPSPSMKINFEELINNRQENFESTSNILDTVRSTRYDVGQENIESTSNILDTVRTTRYDVGQQNIELSTSNIPDSIQNLRHDIAALMTISIKIREQNSQILGILREKNVQHQIPESFSNKLPAKTIEEFMSLEEDIADSNKANLLVAYLSSLGGEGIVTKTNKILKALLTDDLATHYNFKGRNKFAFGDLKLKGIIVQIVKSKIINATTVEIELAIKNWLKHAPQRTRLQLKKV
ncbi:uncharacterized protein LOC114344889 [Diabrotica virgifera virgifera]|uniref:DUF4806 domain-containing protein n=1 Tax=Diabrotica virgifera virgifera TaxID=50390 RepID=A0ABM5IZ95_DIAVI|nr:uncharacterized protein LOC114344889 [Diabrotica virgifera virgifera]